MNIFRHYGQGIREASRQPKMIFLLWLVNGLFGLVVYFLYSGLISRVFGNSLWAEELFDSFCFQAVMELVAHRGRELSGLVSVVLMIALASALLSLFFSGGVLNVFVSRHRPQNGSEPGKFEGRFFQGAGKYFGRFLRLELYALSQWVAFLVFFMGLAALAGSLTDDWEKEQLGFVLAVALAAMACFLFFLGRMIIDYARIHIVATDTMAVLRTYGATVVFVLKNLFKLLGLYYLFVLTIFVILAGGVMADHAGNERTTAMIWMSFAVQQFFLLILIWVRLALQAGQVRLSEEEGGKP